MQKYAHLNSGVKKMGHAYTNQEKMGQSYTVFLEKRGHIVYLAALKKGAIRAAHPYHVIYRELPARPAPPPPSLVPGKVIKYLSVNFFRLFTLKESAKYRAWMPGYAYL